MNQSAQQSGTRPLSQAPGVVVRCFVEALIRKSLEVLIEPGAVHELRAIDVESDGRTYKSVSGYYDDLGGMARDAASLDERAKGIYFTLNPLRPEALARSPNQLRRGRQGGGASDTDVVKRRWLPVDLDPVRPANTNATEEEIAAAVERAEAIWGEGRRLGWEEPLSAVSGNGAHLLFPIDLPVDDGGLVHRSLQRLGQQLSDDRVRVDTSVSNPSRIWRCYGTLAMKGPATEERPHRRSALLWKGWSRREP